MANISVRKNDEANPTTITRPQEPRWEPFRMMRDLMAWDPFREMTPFPLATSAFMPSFDVKETKEAYVFTADLPGVKEADIDVTVSGNRLTVAGKREAEKHEQHDTYYAFERSYGSFTRSFTLPEGVDLSSAHADLKDGVLTLSVRKKPEAQAKKIAVQTPAKKS